ncbi:EpsG family protein [Sporomusa malonica]|uniref:EpsG family protein n=1 Tax=Sporomusa malonica TaxID=112901 RepID=A0A1W2DLV2_9FIRM|nr:EpsG family protein [Sporomusa malonica]SMC98042.1 EpsG family protein [Sporomusa malonica]
MSVYYLTILTTGIAAWIAQLSEQRMLKSFFVFFTAIILALVAGLRWGVGADYFQYALNYSGYSASNLTELVQFEIGIRVISVVSQYLYDDYATMFFIASLLTIGLFVFTIAKNSNMFVFSILLFIFIGSWNGTFNAVRQFLACAVLFAGHRYIIERNFLKYLLVVGIATAFHVSAIIMLPLFFIAARKVDFKQILLLTFAVIILIFSYDYLFTVAGILKDSTIEMDSYMTTQVSIWRVAVNFAPLGLLLLRTGNDKMITDFNFYLNMLIINAAVMAATMNSAYLARVGIYTTIYTTIALPKILERFDSKTAMILKFIIVSCYAIYWYIEVSANPSLNDFTWIFER